MEAIQIFIFGTGLGNLAVLGAVDEVGMHTFVQMDPETFVWSFYTFYAQHVGGQTATWWPRAVIGIGQNFTCGWSDSPGVSLKSLKRAGEGYILLIYHFHLKS